MAPEASLSDGLTAFPSFESSQHARNTAPHDTQIASQSRRTSLRRPGDDQIHDVVGIGFGPANLAFAIAIQDTLESSNLLEESYVDGLSGPKVAFVERQGAFGWHEGMLLPSAKMQISFLKDLATFRDPRSAFTFLNYLHKKQRLAAFSNLGTFLPKRREYADYMRWCAEPFEEIVDYGHDVLGVRPNMVGSKVTSFSVDVQDKRSNASRTLETRKAVIAIGGQANIPSFLPQWHPQVVHSSSYLKQIGEALPEQDKPYIIAVIGGGQSAAETFNDLHTRYSNARTRLIIRDSALRPSDDSPFVNEVFDPDRVDSFYDAPPEARAKAVAQDRATNYSVVRLELLEHMYEDMYTQRLAEPDHSKWQHQILNHRNVVECTQNAGQLKLKMVNSSPSGRDKIESPEYLDCDAVVIAAGYRRDGHASILKPLEHLRPRYNSNDLQEANAGWKVRRDYSVEFDPEKIDSGCAIYLSGCNEGTHGVGPRCTLEQVEPPADL